MAAPELTLKLSPALGKVLYASLFIGALPWALLVWVNALDPGWLPPPIHAPRTGLALALTSASLLIAGWHALWVHGKGLPMNAYPPRHRVSRGAYRLVSHPVYVGFVGVLFGLALVTGSPALLWLVAPVAALACAALVWGYELQALERLFGPHRPSAWIGLPSGSGRPTLAQRTSVLATLLAPWALLYESVTRLGPPDHPIETFLSFERSLPVVSAAYPLYVSVYAVTLAIPFVARDVTVLRRFVAGGLVACVLVFPLFWFLPLVAPPKAIALGAPFSDMLAFERALDSERGALPSFHVIFAVLSATAIARTAPRLRGPAAAWTAGVGLSCVAVGMHALLDVVIGLVLGLVATHYDRAWIVLRSAAERIANSWREWNVGPLRIIVHAGWAALASGAGVFIVIGLLGASAAPATIVATVCGLVGAATWAQAIEGSPVLLRPFGFYGGLLGIIAGSLAAPWFGISSWALLAAWAVAGPWVQALGRLRCLVQGCCHGAPAPEYFGIRYFHARSRVVRLSPWRAEPVHPTPLYSILGNAPTALVAARLFARGLPAPVVCGIFLVLNGLTRFSEEAYRGETQSPVRHGLRFYQWMAAATVIAGAWLTTAPGPPCAGRFIVSGAGWFASLGAGAVVGLALGVDFPRSNRRFSRLV